MTNNYIGTPDIAAYDSAVKKLRAFFSGRGFVEVHTQDRLSILAACEDPTTIASFNYTGEIWPLPQTGQMWLEYELLKNPSLPGVFCVSTSFRQEPNPIPGRHKVIFPMFEFEAAGTMEDLRQLEEDLLVHLEFGQKSDWPHINYIEASQKYGAENLTATHETQMVQDFGQVVFLENFPEYTSPFWNMRRNTDGTARKIDVIMAGMETIGSAERAIDKAEMRERFMTISDGGYAKLLFEKFGEERVMKELNEFLALPFFPRFGGGIGLTRLMRALEMAKRRQ